MNPLSEDIKDMLIASSSSVDLTFGTNLFISSMPNMPDFCACIYDTGGMAPEHNYNYMRPTFQVAVRGNRESGYREAWKLAESIRNELYAIHNETWNSVWYIGIWVESGILFVGYDENKRPLLTVNFRVHRSE